MQIREQGFIGERHLKKSRSIECPM